MVTLIIEFDFKNDMRNREKQIIFITNEKIIDEFNENPGRGTNYKFLMFIDDLIQSYIKNISSGNYATHKITRMFTVSQHNFLDF